MTMLLGRLVILLDTLGYYLLRPLALLMTWIAKHARTR